LSITNRMVIATGIANIWARDPLAMTAAQLTLTEAYPERFLLGLGVSHARLVEGIRGHQYQQPFTAMRRYLDGMDAAARAYRAPKPAAPPPRVLAALGPRMLALAAEGPRVLIRISSRPTTRRSS
jgi:alkanesulfonate monooxygenase SsuD/methylene tetrahydromethanopterin reductase-like flavin-dependent oxidoreductase (luciferase family)